MKKTTTILFGLILFLAQSGEARTLRVITTTPDLSSIAGEVGGDRITVSSLVKGTQDPHFIEPRPSMVARLRDADLFIVVGMEIDVWAFSLIDAAKNHRIIPGSSGYLNASARIEKLEVPAAGVRIDASRGHIHPAGNPHYWLDPKNGSLIAETIVNRLAELSPDDREYFKANLATFKQKTEKLVEEVKRRLAPFGPIQIITYHKSWPYFARRFDLKVVGQLEPLPGIAPSPKHLSRVVGLVKEENVSLILQENFYSRRPADFVAGRTGIPVVVVPNSVGASPEAKDYFSLFRVIVSQMVEALKKR